MRYYLIAGERSGDMHGANLIHALKEEDPQAQLRCWGGNQMEAAGAELVVHYRSMAVMGFWEVIKNLWYFKKRLDFCIEDIKAYKPDALILIDYAGFNLRIAKKAKALGIKVHYYISPKIWAWNQKRALKIKANVDYMYAILPFEKEFYYNYQYDVTYVGNPLFDAIRAFNFDPDFPSRYGLTLPIIAVLPGSRKQEIEHMLATMLKVRAHFPNYQFVVAGVDNLPDEFYDLARTAGVKVITGATYDLLSHAKAALVTSGTATLETALFEVPQVVCYHMSPSFYFIASLLVKVKYISLVNLVADRLVVPELIQKEMSVENISNHLLRLLENKEARDEVAEGYAHVKQLLGTKKASQQTARLIIEHINKG